MKNPQTTTLFASSFAFGIVALALANKASAATDLSDLLCKVGGLLQQAIGVLAALALLVFVWGLVKFIARAGSDEGRKEGKQVMIWGVVALFVLVSLWGIVGFIQSSVLEPSPQGVPVPPNPGC